MSTQETNEQYKVNWLRKSSYRVRVPKTLSGENCLAWCNETLEEKVWSHSFNPENNQYTLFFESPALAEQFRSNFEIADQRTVDLT